MSSLHINTKMWSSAESPLVCLVTFNHRRPFYSSFTGNAVQSFQLLHTSLCILIYGTENAGTSSDGSSEEEEEEDEEEDEDSGERHALNCSIMAHNFYGIIQHLVKFAYLLSC